MKPLPAIALALLFGSAYTHAQNAALPPLQGLTISLSSSHQTVALPPVVRAGRQLDAIGVLASVRNRSAQPVEVAFTDLEAARGKFVFSLYREEDDELLWSSLGQAPARVAARVSESSLRLPRKTAWTSSARVPLQIEGEWLAAGKYRIEAVLAGSPSVFAALGFEVTAAEVPAMKSGIRGLVLSPSIGINPKPAPMAGAAVSIRPVKPISNTGGSSGPDHFNGKTDNTGRFVAPLIAGEYIVTASWGDHVVYPHDGSGDGDVSVSSGSSANSGVEVAGSEARLSPAVIRYTGTAKVTVKANEMSEVTIQLRRGTIGDPRPPEPQHLLVLSVDDASAGRFTGDNGAAMIRVQASGTVPHPGHGNPRLVLSPVIPMIAPADGGGLIVLNFVVDPPRPDLFYPMVIATVEASVELPDNGETLIWIHSQGERTTLTLPAAGVQ